MIALSKEFVTATDEVGRLQRGDDPESVFFQEMAEHGHFGGRPGSTRQGIYVCAPSGKFLASINHTRPDRVLEMLREGLAAWEALPLAERGLKDTSVIEPRHRWEDSYPDDGLVINVFSRDLPETCDPSEPCAPKWNQDFLWYSAGEARTWLGEDPHPGDVHTVPDSIISRIARFHLVDNVKGETPNFSKDGVANSLVTSEVIERVGSTVMLRIEGTTQGAAGEGWWQSENGVVTRLLGKAEYDLTRGAFTEFEIVALGRRWGYTRFNGRERDPNAGPVGYVLRLAPKDSPKIAPTHIASYGTDWVQYPDSLSPGE